MVDSPGSHNGDREVIAELIYNAVDAMPQGGTLTISADVEEEMLVVRFTDTGVGMDEAAVVAALDSALLDDKEMAAFEAKNGKKE